MRIIECAITQGRLGEGYRATIEYLRGVNNEGHGRIKLSISNDLMKLLHHCGDGLFSMARKLVPPLFITSESAECLKGEIRNASGTARRAPRSLRPLGAPEMACAHSKKYVQDRN